MKRRPRKLLLFLLAFLVCGAIINVAVAWGCSIVFNPATPNPRYATEAAESVVIEAVRCETFGTTLIIVNRLAENNLRVDVSEIMGENFSAIEPHYQTIGRASSEFDDALRKYGYDSIRESQYVLAAGWPVRSLLCYPYHWVGHGDNDLHDLDRGYLTTSLPAHNKLLDRVVPLVPIFPGFAINTIFYAAVLWVLFALPVKVRRWRRIKRGQCASCGYSLRGTSGGTCPECGITC